MRKPNIPKLEENELFQLPLAIKLSTCVQIVARKHRWVIDKRMTFFWKLDRERCCRLKLVTSIPSY